MTELNGIDLEQLRKDEKEKSGGKFWKIPNGTSTVRILPGLDGKSFYYETAIHYINGKSVACRRRDKSSDGTCPICAYVSKLYDLAEKEGGDENHPAKKKASKIRAKQTFMYNIYLPKTGETVMMKSGPKIKDGLLKFFLNDKYGDISHPIKGRFVEIERKGEGLSTAYNVVADPERTPVSPQKEGESNEETVKRIKAILDARSNLTTQYAFPSLQEATNELNVFLGLSNNAVNASVEDDDDDVEEEKPAKKAAPSKTEDSNSDATLEALEKAMAELS